MKNCVYKDCIISMFKKLSDYARRVSFIPNLIVRIYLAEIFFISGLAKLDDWNGTLFLFQYEYYVPLLNYKLAACLALFMELVASTFLFVGLGTRFAALGLLIMSYVIKVSYIEALENNYWMLLFSLLVVYGGDKLSADYWLKRKFFSKK